ncbi:metal-sensing transcriptional repressor [Martelella lutilitoris]|uniref:Metal-sensing transcriptional repressor n=1 Tax=Martelella lutilitoris TaxID=2583532 RepID=A0A5C4JPE7_9HYPH|nr:metal-sensing transcriptional repressor [Martelella lutilitoris]TNB47345.1 metal-sensing transcriptional repressor [Martelella lutilitoris]
MSHEHRHQSHPRIVARLKRAEGHLNAVVAMIEAGRPCLDVAQQLQAVESAIRSAKQTLIHDHVDHCLDARNSEAEREELKAITRYL